ncbi:hypothetical protein WICPIJ_007433 [Wickerhamomyces pijperi]|uniref:Protein kinase domain-containing protein n=1 Tax=Wickerhamomyces pijperi TaxID=599730 RepID=A0A9P8TJX5_WICPI|nr:hypothetical protein WICPIJ_007433 [Wickerhamomyces pijperi]
MINPTELQPCPLLIARATLEQMKREDQAVINTENVQLFNDQVFEVCIHDNSAEATSTDSSTDSSTESDVIELDPEDLEEYQNYGFQQEDETKEPTTQIPDGMPCTLEEYNSITSEDGKYLPKTDLKVTSNLSQFFQFEKELGKGSFGTVTSVTAKPGFDYYINKKQFPRRRNSLLDRRDNEMYEMPRQSYALKTIPQAGEKFFDVWKLPEIEFIYNVPHQPNLLRVYETLYDTTQHNLCIVMEKMGSRDLQSINESNVRGNCRFDEPMIRSILRQLAQAVQHIHNQGYIHRDIKPENVLLTKIDKYYKYGKPGTRFIRESDPVVVKLSDYGLSMKPDCRNPTKHGHAGTLPYIAPEGLLKISTSRDKPLDIWAIGCVAFELLMGEGLIVDSTDKQGALLGMMRKLGTPFRMKHETHTRDMYPDKQALGFGYWKGSEMLLRRRLDFQRKDFICFQRGIADFFDFEIPVEEVSSFKDLIQLIQACLKWNPRHRATADQVLGMPFFTRPLSEYEQ